MLSTTKTYAPDMDSTTKINQPKPTKARTARTNKTLRFATNPTTYHYTHIQQSVYQPKHKVTLSAMAIAEMPQEELKNYMDKLEAQQVLIAKLIFPKNF